MISAAPYGESLSTMPLRSSRSVCMHIRRSHADQILSAIDMHTDRLPITRQIRLAGNAFQSARNSAYTSAV